MCRLQATHALDDELDLGIADDVIVACRHARIAQTVRQLEDAGDVHALDALGDDLIHPAPDGSMAKQCDVHGVPIFPLCVVGAGR